MGYTVPPHCTCVGLWWYIMCGLYCTTSLHLCGFVGYIMCGLYCTTSLHLCGFVGVHNVCVILYHLTAPVWVCGGIFCVGYTVPPHCTCVGLWWYIMCGLYCTTSLHLCGFVGVHNVWVILYHLTAPVWVCGGT